MKGKYMQSLPTPYQEFIHLSRYARWRDDLGRRETWPETVLRWKDFWSDRLVHAMGMEPSLAEDFMEPLAKAIQRLDVMPSMRSLMTAGPALARDNVAGFNCAYIEIDDIMAFPEVMYILMCGTGVGFSVERQCVKRLPEIAESLHEVNTTIVVEDSKTGWAAALRQLISLLVVGQVPKWDMSLVRPRGARLMTFGGRASGPEPLDSLFKFIVGIFKEVARSYSKNERESPRLTSLECHDIVCKIADIVVVGGVRRSALISLSNLSDDRMRNAKNGAWYETQGHRALANNSAAYTEKPNFEVFMKELMTLYESKSGERGIFSRMAAQKKAAESGRRDASHDFGTNPCGEIILRSAGFCNLSEIVLRPSDSLEAVKAKVRYATMIGTLQSTLTDYRFLRSKWKHNAEEERLLGVSITGIMDHPVFARADANTAVFLTELRQLAIDVNKEFAAVLGIAPSAAITTVKPSGTVSQLVNSSSGIHPRHSSYYIRRVRQDNKDPITKFLIASGVPNEPAQGKEDSMTVFEFPIHAPPSSPTRHNVGAMQQLALYAMYRESWCEHNPSTTIYYTDNDFFAVAQWIWQNFDRVGGVSFLPSDDHMYPQAPYEDITAEEYERRLATMPTIDWTKLTEFEKDDYTTPTSERACVGGACEL
jgi:ribonucleoside-diphosphate reductase alpha chain